MLTLLLKSSVALAGVAAGLLLCPKVANKTSHLRPRILDKTLSCVHGRAIDYAVDANGARTGSVYCLECKEIFDDPAW
jgi:hypothetical protein